MLLKIHAKVRFFFQICKVKFAKYVFFSIFASIIAYEGFFIPIISYEVIVTTMKWRLFNPEHDMALAAGTKGFTPPAAGRGMRYWLGFLPTFWAEEGDVVIVDDVKVAQTCAAPFQQWLPKVTYATFDQTRCFVKEAPLAPIDVWGWDAAIKWQLLKTGVIKGCEIPDDAMIETIRRLSHRQASIPVLNALVEANVFTLGERHCLHTVEEVRTFLEIKHKIIVKAPWSSSGRGIRYLHDNMSGPEAGFVANIIRQQGSIIAEPWYDKVMDFALEFTSNGYGDIVYEGLSVFDTSNGAYTGNLLLPEEQKLHILATYIELEKFSAVKEQLLAILEHEMSHVYAGPLGVDMMVVHTAQGYLLHPCIEINLRRTMGYVALNVACRTHHQFRTMRIVPGTQYRLLLE